MSLRLALFLSSDFFVPEVTHIGPHILLSQVCRCAMVVLVVRIIDVVQVLVIRDRELRGDGELDALLTVGTRFTEVGSCLA